MAQTASEGRYGITKKLLTKLKKLLFVSSIGDGLSLSDAGVLSTDVQDVVEDIALTNITVNKGTLDTTKCFIQKCGKLIVMAFRLTDVTASSGDTIITLPDWMKPKTSLMTPVLIGGTVGMKMFRVDSNSDDAQIVTIDAISNLSLYVCVTSWFIDHEPENNS